MSKLMLFDVLVLHTRRVLKLFLTSVWDTRKRPYMKMNMKSRKINVIFESTPFNSYVLIFFLDPSPKHTDTVQATDSYTSREISRAA